MTVVNTAGNRETYGGIINASSVPSAEKNKPVAIGLPNNDDADDNFIIKICCGTVTVKAAAGAQSGAASRNYKHAS